MIKGIIYYTDSRLGEPIFSVVQRKILEADLPIVSASLKPVDFGKNYVLDLQPKYLTMLQQITKALEMSQSDYVFFCEHDVLYPLSHFNFTPPRDDTFYYNIYVWKWKYPENVAVTYDYVICLSALCVNREFALNHFKSRLKKIYDLQYDSIPGNAPHWARKWGYEPGIRPVRRGGFSDDNYVFRRSTYPIIDIRHGRTFSPPKATYESYKSKPGNWREITLDKIPGWNLQELFNLTQ